MKGMLLSLILMKLKKICWWNWGVDYLAIAVGTAHGVYKGEPRLDFDRIKTIKDILNIPLVLHGSSGVPKEAIEKQYPLE